MNTISSKMQPAVLWIFKNIDLFNPIEPRYDEKQSHKMFSELQFTLSELHLTYNRWDPVTQKLIDELKKISKNIITSPLYYEQLQLHPSMFRMFGMAAMYFLSYCTDDDTCIVQDIVKKTYKTACNISSEAPPFRQMELAYCIYNNNHFLHNTDFNYNSIARIADLSILRSNYDLANFTIHHEYPLTHAIFYLTNMGRIKVNVSDFPNLEESLNILACKNILNSDLDLLGEYLINLCCFNINNQILKDSLQFILSNQKSDGIFPAPIRDRIQQPEIECTEIDKYVRKHYHTTLVCIIALSIYTRTFIPTSTI